MPTAIDENVLFKFGTPDIPEDDPSGYGLHVVNFHGEEGISRPYWFRLNLTSRDPKLDFDALVNQPGRLTLQRADRKCYLHGIVSSFEQGGRDGDWFLYRAVLRPRLWALTLTHRSRVFQNRSVPEIVREIFEEHGVPHELEVRDTYEPREYVVQYNETDLAFISRLLAHEGIRFIFAQGEQRETVHLFDSRGQDPWVEGPTEMRYQLPDGMVLDETEVISEVFVREQAVPGKVVLKDYNYRSPSSDLTSEEQDQNGKGEIYEYGLHFKDRSEGKRLAKVRKEEVGGQRRILAGRGNGIGFRAGHRFTLHGHYRDDLNEDYLLVRVRHFGGQEQAFGTAGRREFDGRGSEGVDYRNEFGCAPARVPFRTPRLSIVENFFSDTFFNATFENTIAPVFNLSVAVNTGERTGNGHQHGQMYGLMTAPVQGGGGYGAVDDEGRYHVQLPFDREGAGSRPIRLAQPYAGAGDAGFHFPSHAGNEIVFACVDGDPDRPLALGFVPNPEHPSPVTSENSSQHVLKTTSDNEFVIEDKENQENILLYTPYGNTFLNMGYDSPKNGIFMRTDDNMVYYSQGSGLLHGSHGLVISAWPKEDDWYSHYLAAWIPALKTLASMLMDYARQEDNVRRKTKTFKGQVKEAAKSNLSKFYSIDVGSIAKMTKDFNKIGTLYNHATNAHPIGGHLGRFLDEMVGDVSKPGISLGALGEIKIASKDEVSVKAEEDLKLDAKQKITLSSADNSIGLIASEGISLFAQDDGIEINSKKDAIKIKAASDIVMLRAEENLILDSMKGHVIMRAEGSKSHLLMAGQEAHLSADDQIHLTSDKEIILECGQSKMTLKKNGDIEISGKKILCDAKTEVKLKTGQNVVKVDNKSILVEIGSLSGIEMNASKVGIDSTMVAIDASAKATLSGSLVESKAKAMNVVKGGIVKIN